MKRIGILGSGIVAQTLGSGFLKHGFQVMLGTRDTTKLSSWKEQAGEYAETGSFTEASRFGDIVILAVAGRAALAAIKQAGPENMTSKTVIDTTNPIDEAPPKDGVLKYFTNGESLMEILQNNFPEIHFVKAFNSVGNAFMVDPGFTEGKPTMFICGNSEDAKKDVSGILDIFGWEVEDMGKANAAGCIESLCVLWCIPGFLRNQWTHAFKLLKA